MLQRLLLGPQRPVINLGEVVAAADIPDAPVAVISAGWQEAEGDMDELRAIIKRPLVSLDLYQRAERVFAADEPLRAAYRQRQDRLQELQRLYRLRLRQLMIAARQVKRASTASDLVAAELRHALSQLRALDRHQLRRIDAIYADHSEQISVTASPLLAEQTEAIRSAVAPCPTVLITGGNVLVLLNRLQLFDMRGDLAERHLIAWSAGAMVLSDLVVLYHDQTPLGRRDPEVLGAGMGVVPGHVLLPDAKRRLQAKDVTRISLFTERFSPARCVTLDNGAALEFAGDQLQRASGAGYLTARGGIASLGPL